MNYNSYNYKGKFMFAKPSIPLIVTEPNNDTPIEYLPEKNSWWGRLDTVQKVSIVVGALLTLLAVAGGICYLKDAIRSDYSIGMFFGGIGLNILLILCNICRKKRSTNTEASNTVVKIPTAVSSASDQKSGNVGTQAVSTTTTVVGSMAKPKLVAAALLSEEDQKIKQEIMGCRFDPQIAANLPKEKTSEIDLILPSIYLGRRSPVVYIAENRGPNTPEINLLKQNVLNLTVITVGNVNEQYTYIEHAHSALKAKGAEVHHIAPEAMDDTDAILQKPALDQAYNIIHTAQQSGRLIFIHCIGGQKRSASILAYYIMRRYGVSAENALGYIQSKRRWVCPSLVLRHGLFSLRENGIPRSEHADLPVEQLQKMGLPLFDQRLKDFG